MVLSLFTIWQVVNLSAAYLASRFIPYLGFFPYGYVLNNYHLPKFIASLANFDGAHYILIAHNGYAQYQQAFFPLYPLLIRHLSPLLAGNELLTGLLISNICFLLGLIVFKWYINLMSQNMDKWPIIFLLVFPTSFFFTALYTEGLFFFLVVSTLYFLEKENYLRASLFAFLASLTRLTGLFLIIPFLIKIIQVQGRNAKFKAVLKILISNIQYLISPLLGFFIYSLYLLKTTGDPLFFFHSQPAFGANRSTQMIILPQVIFRYLKILFTAKLDFRYFISLFELTTFSLVFFVLILDLINIVGCHAKNADFCIAHLRRGIRAALPNFFALGGIKKTHSSMTKSLTVADPVKENLASLLGLNLFSLLNILLPTLTGTFSSIPRYSLMSLSFFIALGGIKNTPLKILLAVVFFILNIALLGFFIQGYFIS